MMDRMMDRMMEEMLVKKVKVAKDNAIGTRLEEAAHQRRMSKNAPLIWDRC
jgi:uncharacterized protein YlbG (UPF0298 family)